MMNQVIFWAEWYITIILLKNLQASKNRVGKDVSVKPNDLSLILGTLYEEIESVPDFHTCTEAHASVHTETSTK